MAVGVLINFAWGGATGREAGVAHDMGTVNRGIIAISVNPLISVEDTWTIAGKVYVRGNEGGVAGVVQWAEVFLAMDTLLYLRSPEVGSSTPPVVKSRRLFFEPVPWLTEGTLQVRWDTDNIYNRSANYGGGFE